MRARVGVLVFTAASAGRGSLTGRPIARDAERDHIASVTPNFRELR